jgi:hypothetical protein
MEGIAGLGGMPPGGEAAEAAAESSAELVDLSDKIDKSDCYAKNEASGFPMSNLFIGDSRLGCKSDADEQLIFHIAFQEFVKVRLHVENGNCCLTKTDDFDSRNPTNAQ